MAKTATKWLIIVSVVIGFSASGWAQDAGKTESSKSNTPFSTRWEQANDVGEVEYLTSCSACHGLDGRGDGPLRGELKSKPADLTVLAKKNNGVFPLNAIYETIDGRKSVSAHGILFAAYVSRHGHAFIDRALYLPKGWTDDPARLKATYVPGDVGFSTKPQLAAEMIERALAAGVPFRWVAADSVYGVGDIERELRQAGKGYVLGVNSNHWFASWGKPQRVIGTAEEIAKTQRRSDWRRLSAGAGTKGPRLHDWCYLELADLEGEESNHHSQVLWTRGLLIEDK